jgi:hypothetical protein
VIHGMRLKNVGHVPSEDVEGGAVGWDCARSAAWPVTDTQSACSHIWSMGPAILIVSLDCVPRVEDIWEHLQDLQREAVKDGGRLFLLSSSHHAASLARHMSQPISTDLLVTFGLCLSAVDTCNRHAFGR